MMTRRTLLTLMGSGVALGAMHRAAGAATIDGPTGRLRVVDAGGGNGLPVVFIHSFAGSSWHWTAQLDYLGRMRRAAAFDVRGHGRSERPASLNAFAVERMAGDVAAVMDSLRLDRAVLVGSSMGGPIALAFAQRQPKRVAGMVLVGPPGKTEPEQAAKIVANLVADYEKAAGGFLENLLNGATPETRAIITREFWALPKDASLAIIRSLFAFDPLPPLDGFAGPVLLVTTQQNDQPPDLHRLRPALAHVRIEGTSHWPHMDKPDQFNGILDEFLKRVRT